MPCSTLEKAHRAVDSEAFDYAVIDLNLHGETAIPIADRLLATGYGSSFVPDRLRGVPRIEKPFDQPAPLHVVAQLSCARIEGSSA